MLDHVCLARAGAFAVVWFASAVLAENAPIAPTHEQVMQDALEIAAMGSTDRPTTTLPSLRLDHR